MTGFWDVGRPNPKPYSTGAQEQNEVDKDLGDDEVINQNCAVVGFLGFRE